MNIHRNAVYAGLMAALAAASTASAANYTINWLNMAPTPFGSSVPNNSVFNWPGGGTVTVNYSVPTQFIHARVQDPNLTVGNVVNGPDIYSWTGFEEFGATNLATSITGIPWSITYKFSNTVPNGSLYLGVSGLGQTQNNGGGASIVTVNENGTFLGDWAGAGNYGATQFTPGNPFQMQNSLTGPGGLDPWWNSKLGVVQINNAINSFTVNFNQIGGDGAGLNIGFAAVPEPFTLGFMGIGALFAARRRPGRV